MTEQRDLVIVENHTVRNIEYFYPRSKLDAVQKLMMGVIERDAWTYVMRSGPRVMPNGYFSSEQMHTRVLINENIADHFISEMERICNG